MTTADELREHVARLVERLSGIATRAERAYDADERLGVAELLELHLIADAALDAGQAGREFEALGERIRETACQLAGRDEPGGYAGRLGGGS